jgi:hypothetical protein
MGTLNRTAIATLVERRLRHLILVHLPDGHTSEPSPGPRDRRARRRAGLAAAHADLGSRQGAGHARTDRGSDRAAGVLLRGILTVAARDEREHKWAAAPALPQGQRLEPLHRRGSRPRRAELTPTQKDPLVRNPRTAPRRATVDLVNGSGFATNSRFRGGCPFCTGTGETTCAVRIWGSGDPARSPANAAPPTRRGGSSVPVNGPRRSRPGRWRRPVQPSNRPRAGDRASTVRGLPRPVDLLEQALKGFRTLDALGREAAALNQSGARGSGPR